MSERQEATAWQKFVLLMWKNFLLQWRHKGQTAAELCVPVLAMALVLILRSQIEPYVQGEINYKPIRVDTFYSANESLLVLTGMNVSQMSIAYSPESSVLDDVINSAISKLFVKNIVELYPVLVGIFPDLGELPIGAENITQIVEISRRLVRVIGYNSSSDLNDLYQEESLTRVYLAAVEFPDNLYGTTVLPTNVSYSLRFPEIPRMSAFYSQGSRSWRTNAIFPTFPLPGPREPYASEGGNSPGYMNELFIALQHSISMEIISRLTGENLDSFNVNVQRYPHPAYTSDLAIQALLLIFPMIVLLSFSYTAVNIVRAVTVEKELQIKESMKIMGLPTWTHWTAWFCKQFIYLVIIAALVVVLLKMNWFSTEAGLTEYAVFTSTPWTILFFFTVLYLSSVIFLCFMISGFFAKANTAALFTGVIWFIIYAPAAFLSIDETVSLPVQIISCLSVNSAMAYGYQLLLTEESNGGMQWTTFFSTNSSDESRLLFGHVVLMIVLDSILYMLIALYMEQVNPGPFGMPKPWYFLFQGEFWSANKNKISVNATTEINDIPMEKEPSNHSIGVKIENMTKIFGKNIAVNNLNLNIYNDQITVLLGHNGAGKSTTISVLIGNLSSDHGIVTVAGYDIQKQVQSARAHMGFCPQHNVLFPELTVKEHLEFFCKLKGLSGEEMNKEIDTLINKLELQEKRDYESNGLSGGQKRRLSVGIALCGGAKVVLLDEPTSGMDPASRRALWTLLQKEKYDRSIILTTHFMDEADYLGDRVAIMSSGQLQCVGSPYFLKRYYGVGYTLIVVKGSKFDTQSCTGLIRKYIPDACVKEDKGLEVTYSISNDYSNVFESMLSDLENNTDAVGFTHYGLVATTLEDVFMTVGTDAENFDCDGSASTVSVTDDKNIFDNDILAIEDQKPEEKQVIGIRLIRQHMNAIWYKLFIVWKRSLGLLSLQLLVPILMINTALGIFTYIVNLSDVVQPRDLTLAQSFKFTETYLTYQGDNVTSLGAGAMQAYQQMFNTNNMIVSVIENQTLDNYYLEQGDTSASMTRLRSEVVIGATLSDSSATAWFSNFGYHDVAISVATLHKALLKSKIPDSELNVVNHPMRANYKSTTDLQIIVSMLAMQLSDGFGHTLSIISAVFVMFYIRERVSKAKLLQKASGIQPIVMWGSAAVFDFAWFAIICITLILSCVAFQVIGMSSFIQLSRLYLILLIYGASMLPFIYAVSYLFSGPTYGFVVVFFLNVLFGTMAAQIVEALWTLNVETVPEIMDYILQFFPLYCVTTSIRKVHEIDLKKWGCMRICNSMSQTYLLNNGCTMENMCTINPMCCIDGNGGFTWQEPGIGRYLFGMSVSCVVFWIIIMCTEYRIWQKIQCSLMSSPPEMDYATLDPDVAKEAKEIDAITNADLQNNNIVTRKLTKFYGKNLAVNQVSFSVKEGECFGLLGVNGAGKTSTFKMLMGDEHVSSGDAFICGYSVRKNIKKVHENIGYCPQFDAIFEEMTARETLRFFGLLRGLSSKSIALLTLELASSLGFSKHLDKRVGECSGGTVRKISLGVALLGVVGVVFLDEPTTGVDAYAKRQVWRAIRRATRTRRAVLLTSHQMDECEALCSRLTVMVNGQFQCLGTPQHLKNKFSQGFTLTIKVKSEAESVTTLVDPVKEYVTSNFYQAKLMEEYQSLLTYYLPDRTIPWSRMFGLMEKARSTLSIENYSISQTTLEQIFLQFTKYQKEAL